MKKIIALVLGVVFVVTGFSACSFKNEFQDGPSSISKTGVLVEQITLDKESGTHFLTDNDGVKTAARSLIINLSGSEYLNNKVKAEGVMNTTDNVFEITGITVEEILSKDTKQNKPVEFKDTDAGFKLVYFDDWKAVASDKKNVFFTAPLVAGSKVAANISVSQKPFVFEPKPKEDGTLNTALEVYYEQENPGKKFASSLLSKVGIDGMDALKKVENGKTTYTLYRSGLVYELNFAPADPVNADDETTFNKMIADFQFISLDDEESLPEDQVDEVVSTEASTIDLPKLEMGMTTFESLPYQFSGQYPSKWYYAGVKSATDASILHHYGFSDEASNAKEIISLDVLTNGIPAGGTKLSFSGKSFDVFEKNDSYTVYTTLKTRNFRIMGPAAYKDLILFMAAKLEVVEVEKAKLD